MDTFSASVLSPQELNQVNAPYKPSASFRVIFLLSLLAVLASAVATTYILITGKKPQIVEMPVALPTADENPFAEEPTTTQINPFIDEAQATVLNPFDGVDSSNPFEQFEDSTADTPTINTEVQNPF